MYISWQENPIISCLQALVLEFNLPKTVKDKTFTDISKVKSALYNKIRMEPFLVNVQSKVQNKNSKRLADVKQVQLSSIDGHHVHVITLPSADTNTAELHPLEVDVNRSREAERRLRDIGEEQDSNNIPITVNRPLAMATVPINLMSYRDPSFSPAAAHTYHYLPADTPSSIPARVNAFEDTSPVVMPDSPGAQHVPDIPLTVFNYKADISDEEAGDDACPTLEDEPDPDVEIDSTEHEKESIASTRCYLCSKPFVHRKNLYAHMRKVHSCQPRVAGSIICPLCGMHFLRQQHLRTHFSSLHEITIEKELKFFITLQDFEEWKEEIEKRTCSYYITKCATRPLAANQTKRYYKCHRSGAPNNDVRDVPNKKRKSCKIGATCPAAMETTEASDGIHVTFWKTHAGHDIESPSKSGQKKKKCPPAEEVIEQTTDFVVHEFEMRKPIESVSVQTIKPQQRRNKKVPRQRTDQAALVEKAEQLMLLLEDVEVKVEYRRLIFNMIDNVYTTVKRRSKTTRKTATTIKHMDQSESALRPSFI